MTLRVDRKKWILYRHSSDFNLLCSVAKFLKSYSKTAISKEEKSKINYLDPRVRGIMRPHQRMLTVPDIVTHIPFPGFLHNCL